MGLLVTREFSTNRMETTITADIPKTMISPTDDSTPITAQRCATAPMLDTENHFKVVGVQAFFVDLSSISVSFNGQVVSDQRVDPILVAEHEDL